MEHLEMEYGEWKGKVEDELIELGHTKIAGVSMFEAHTKSLYWDGYSVFEAAVDLIYQFEGR